MEFRNEHIQIADRSEAETPPPEYFIQMNIKVLKRLKPFYEELNIWKVRAERAPTNQSKSACLLQTDRIYMAINNIRTMADEL
jgi:hypothetical protein